MENNNLFPLPARRLKTKAAETKAAEPDAKTPKDKEKDKEVAKDDADKDKKKDDKKPSKPILSTVHYPPGILGRDGLPEQAEYVVFQNTTIWTSGPEGGSQRFRLDRSPRSDSQNR